MNGSGCKTCPVNPCHTLYYRGSYCAEQRAKFGLGDPQTNAERIRAMTDEELREFLCSITKCEVCRYESWGGCELLKWLKQPVEGK
jgi:hypothetical protein